MADTNYTNPHNTTTHTTLRETRTRETGGSSGIAFIVGILVVVVAFLAWMFFGSVETTTVDGTAPSDVNVTIQSDTPTAAPDAAAPAPEAAAPADAAPADVAPADTAPAPADGN